MYNSLETRGHMNSSLRSFLSPDSIPDLTEKKILVKTYIQQPIKIQMYVCLIYSFKYYWLLCFFKWTILETLYTEC